MANNRIPGPIGMAADPSMVDSGTLCITASSSPGPLSLQSPTTSQSVALALARLVNATQHFADRRIQNTQLRRKYLAECKRCIQALPPLFQQHQISDRHAQRFASGLSLRGSWPAGADRRRNRSGILQTADHHSRL
ncbi:MAG: hypothetical protein M3H12_04515 [Chromatiales bacterium]|nr:hypothetical protein [Gammaproteobacteria bacterium]